MGLFSSGKKHKRQAEAYLRIANRISDYQSEVEFRRQLLSNIRSERIARAQLEVGNYSTTARTSSQQGALANIDSSLAGEADYSYSSSLRSQRITNLNTMAQEEYRKYQKQQKRRAAAFSIAGTVAGAVTGFMTPIGLIAGASIGQGIGQIASGTGQTQYGVQNILNGIGQGIDYKAAEDYRQERQEWYKQILNGTYNYTTTPSGYNRYVAASVVNGTPDYLNGESILLPQPNGTTVKACRGYFA